MDLLELTTDPERREKAAQLQAELREKHGHLVAEHPAQANYRFGLAREQSALDRLQAKPDDEQALNVLAESYALQCKFDRAAEVASDEAHKAEYQAKAEAVSHLGARLCECPLVVVKPSPTDAKGIQEQTQRKVEEVFDGERVIGLYRCSLCGKVSAQV